MPGLRELHAGQAVSLTFEQATQDGCSFRATEVWPADQQPHRAQGGTTGASDAYRSTLTITYDDPDRPDIVDSSA
ncbi:MAG TPA: hypothetical protein VGV65_00580 [Nocardioides sp.]|nr:hypothetical protein [Nocardioides sp.]